MPKTGYFATYLISKFCWPNHSQIMNVKCFLLAAAFDSRNWQIGSFLEQKFKHLIAKTYIFSAVEVRICIKIALGAAQ